MQRLHFILSVILLVALLAGCAPKAPVQPENVKALVNPRSTRVPETPTLIPTTTLEVVPHDPPASCPITVPQNPPFVPPAPYDSLGFEGQFWYGSDSLWTAVYEDGIWWALPHNPEGYTQKIFWWSDLFSLKDELEPELMVTGQRLDAEAPPLNASKATNAYGGDIGEAMLTGVDFPTLGCWKITGQYKKSELSFVIWVAP